MSEQIAGQFVVGDGLQQGSVIEPGSSTREPDLSDWPFTSEQDLRKFIRKEVRASLNDLMREIRTQGGQRLV